MTTMIDKMLARAAELEADAAALRKAAAVLDRDAHSRKATTLDATLKKAATLRAAQRNGHGERAGAPEKPATKARKAPRGHTVRAKAAARQRTAALLAQFDLIEARPSTGKIGVLVHNGYLKRKGQGYIRTSRPFIA